MRRSIEARANNWRIMSYTLYSDIVLGVRFHLVLYDLPDHDAVHRYDLHHYGMGVQDTLVLDSHYQGNLLLNHS